MAAVLVRLGRRKESQQCVWGLVTWLPFSSGDSPCVKSFCFRVFWKVGVTRTYYFLFGTCHLCPGPPHPCLTASSLWLSCWLASSLRSGSAFPPVSPAAPGWTPCFLLIVCLCGSLALQVAFFLQLNSRTPASGASILPPLLQLSSWNALFAEPVPFSDKSTLVYILPFSLNNPSCEWQHKSYWW